MRTLRFYGMSLLAFVVVCAMQMPALADVVISNHPVRIGETTVVLREYTNGPGSTFIRVHENETDAGVVGQRIVAELGGRFIDLVHTGDRFVTFTMSGYLFRFDPNRIFTPQGIERSLRPGSGYDITPVRAAVSGFANTIIALIGEKRPLIALHNNVGGTFRLGTYQRGGFFHRAGKTFTYEGMTSQHNFVVVTSREIADKFVERNISVAYQPRDIDLNDGSLSYRFGQDGVPYINIETRVGQRELQMQLAREAAAILKQRPATVGGPSSR